MSAPGWALLALALALLPAPTSAPLRAAALAAAGRIAAPPRDSTTSVSAVRRGLGRLRLSRRTAVAVALGLLVGGVTLRFGAALGVASAVAVAGGWYLFRAGVRRRSSARGLTRLAAAVQLLVAELRAGSSPAAAFAAAAEAAPERRAALRAAARLLDAGDPPVPALQDEVALRPLALAWEVADRAGAAPADVLGRVADDLGGAVSQRRAVELALAGPRSSAVLLAGLPVLGLWLGAAMGAAPLAFLTGTRIGTVVAGFGLVLDVLGAVWIQRLLDRAART